MSQPVIKLSAFGTVLPKLDEASGQRPRSNETVVPLFSPPKPEPVIELTPSEVVVKQVADLAIRKAEKDSEERANRAIAEATRAMQIRLSESLRQIDQAFSALQRSQTEQLAELAVQVVRELLGGVLQHDSSLLTQIVAQAIASAPKDCNLTVFINPADREQLVMLSEGDELSHITFEDDATLLPGGCLVQSDTTVVDASLNSKLQVLKQGLLEMFSQENTPDA